MGLYLAINKLIVMQITLDIVIQSDIISALKPIINRGCYEIIRVDC